MTLDELKAGLESGKIEKNDNTFLLLDRLEKIKSVIEKYREDNFFLSFSGGKDSSVLSTLLDMAVPGNKIPRVYANTGIEYKMILDFVERERERESIRGSSKSLSLLCLSSRC